MSGNQRSGRKSKPKSERATHAIIAWMRRADKETIERAAARERQPTGRWLGTVGLAEATAREVK